MSQYGSLRRRLRSQLLLVYLTPLLILSIYFHFAYSGMILEGIQSHLLSVAENQRNTVDLFLQERLTNVASAFQSEGLALPPSPGTLERQLAELRQGSRTFVDLGLFSPEGRLVAYAGPHTTLLGKDYSTQEWFTRLRDSERAFVISDVFLGFRGKPHFIVAVRRQVEGRDWFLRASVDPQTFAEFVGSSTLLQDGEALIVNRRGERQTLLASDAQGEPIPLSEPGAKPEIAEVAVGGQEYVQTVAWLRDGFWAVVVRVPKDRAYRAVTETRLIILSILFGALLAIVAVVLRSTRRLVARLEEADTAKESFRYQLFNAAKLASVGEMAAGVAHEINNPLAIIYEEAAMLRDLLELKREISEAELEERLTVIQGATQRGRTITSKLLAFARKHDPDPELTDLNLLVERVIEVREHDFCLANIVVERDFAADLPQVMVSRNLTEQVVLNLLNNAKDAIAPAEGHVKVQTCRADRMVALSITDDGCGMSEEVLAKIFFPFFTTKEVGKGTGLGLSISYGIIESLGGRIDVKSRPGAGSTFTIYLPIASGDCAGERPAAGSRAQAGSNGGTP